MNSSLVESLKVNHTFSSLGSLLNRSLESERGDYCTLNSLNGLSYAQMNEATLLT